MSSSSDIDTEGDKQQVGTKMSKNQMRKQAKFLRRVEVKKKGRKEEQKKARERYKEERQEGGEHKDEVRRVQLERLKAAMTDGKAAKVCVDLQFEQLMNPKELNQLACQLRRVYGSNKSARAPFHLHFVNLVPESKIHRVCCEKNDGFDQYLVTFDERGVQDLFEPSEVVYLTPDSDNVLRTIDPTLVYVIGGLVDDTVLKDTSSHFSRSIGLQTARLPIPEFMQRVEGSGKQVLTINQVFDILVEVNSGEGWAKALAANVPPKTGFVIKENEAVIEEN